MDLWQDIRFGARLLTKAPWFTLAAGTALALGIGANTTVFTLVNAVLFRGLPFDDPESIVAVWTENVQNQQSNVFPPELPGCATIRHRQNDCSNSKDESFHSIPLKSSSHAIHPSDTGTTHDVRYPLTPSSRTKATSVPCARKVFFWPNLDPSEPEQPIDLHDQTAVAKLRETVGVQRIRIPVLRIDHEDFAAGTILPAEPEIGAERVPTGAVL